MAGTRPIGAVASVGEGESEVQPAGRSTPHARDRWNIRRRDLGRVAGRGIGAAGGHKQEPDDLANPLPPGRAQGLATVPHDDLAPLKTGEINGTVVKRSSRPDSSSTSPAPAPWDTTPPPPPADRTSAASATTHSRPPPPSAPSPATLPASDGWSRSALHAPHRCPRSSR